MPSPLTKLSRSASTEEVIVSEHLDELRGRVRLLTWISGLCWTALVLFGGLLVTGMLDWLIHFDESGTRLVFGLAILGGSGWMVWQHLIGPLRQQLSGTFLASRVERRFPGLNHRLVSAVEFLEHRLDAKLGSTELQKAVVRQALKDLEQIRTSDVVETQAVRNVTIAGTVVCAVVLFVVLLRPLEAATSVQRLMFPFASVPWPRAVELELVRSDLSPVKPTAEQPFLIARGDTLELYVQNKRGRLPQRVWFEYRLGHDGSVIRETLRQTTVRDDKGQAHETAVISWIAAQGTMFFRVTGGDDQVMPFHRVEVVPPPTIEALQVIVTPPVYSRRPQETLPPGVGHVQGLLGTRVNATVTSDKPLKSALLRIGEQTGIPLDLDAGGRHFSTSFEITNPIATTYRFELTDIQGFTDREAVRYEMRGIADEVPEVSVENPLADILLTADAELPVKVLAKDDLGLREVRITYQVGDDEKLNSIPLFNSGTQTEGDEPNTSNDSTTAPSSTGSQRREADHLWKMADLQLETGTRIVFRAEATDDYDLGLPHVGKSVPRTVTIVSRDEKQKELAGRVGDLLEDLRQATQLQQRAQQQTQELQTQLEKVGELRAKDLDQLRRAELDQRQVASRLTHPADGVETQARQLLEEFRGNQLDDKGTESRLERLTNELERLEREEFPEAERALTQAQKLAEEQLHHDNEQNSPAAAEDKSQAPVADSTERKPPQTAPATEKALAEAQTRQAHSLETLNELQDSLSEWRDRRDISRDLGSVIAEQESLQKDSAEMAQQTMTKSAAELSKQEKAELNKLAAKQHKVAEQLDQFRKQIEKMAGSLEKNDPDAAEKFNEVGRELNSHETNSTLQDAAQDIADNKMGSAAEAQQKALDELREVERMMKRQPNEDTEQFLKQAQEVQHDIQQLRQDQQALADQVEQLAKEPDSAEKQQQMEEMMERQEELAERMAKTERKLERLRLRGPADAMNRARKRVSEMMKQIQDADGGEEMQQAMDESLDDLEQVERELALEKRIAQERLAFEQLEKIEDELKSLRSRQETILEETTRLETTKTERESLSRGQLKTLKELAESQRALQHDAEQMQQQMASAEVFSLVLKRLARSLMLIADGLSDRETAEPTQSLERDALRKIDSLLAVLKQEKKRQEQQSPAGQQEELSDEPQQQEQKPEEAQPPGDTIPQLAQLKLLKSLQEEYLERTERLNQSRDKDGHLPESMRAEQMELAREQAELADFTRNLIAKFQQQQPEPPQTEEQKSKAPEKEQKKERNNEDDPAKIDL